MEICQFEMQRHYETLLYWLARHKAYLPGHDEMPAIGYMAYDGQQAIACGFLRKVEGGMGQLDGLCTNPEALPSKRHDAIDLVVNRILDEAKALGMRNLLAMSTDKSVLMRSQRHGFKSCPHTLIVVDLATRST